jgi:GNAT superfamily N-acetyltransferase
MHNFMGAELAQGQRQQLRREAEASRIAAVAKSHQPSDSAFQLRALTRADVAHMAELFNRLSPRSRYLRYQAPVRRLTARSLRDFADIDHEDREAVGAFESGVLVGAARYVRDADEPTRAEISIEVADAYQRQGIGAGLMSELARLGRDRGITRFVATALTDNSGVLGLLRQSRWPAVVHRAGSELCIAVTVPDVTVSGE